MLFSPPSSKPQASKPRAAEDLIEQPRGAIAATDLRYRCRNPRCRCKLPEPTANLHEAFCCRGCYDSFHLHRCRVCEARIEQPRNGARLLCQKSKCQRPGNPVLASANSRKLPG